MNTQEKIEVMSAYLQGKAIEVRGDGEEEWAACDAPVWNWDDCEYRVQAEPKVLRAWVCTNNGHLAFRFDGISLESTGYERAERLDVSL